MPRQAAAAEPPKTTTSRRKNDEEEVHPLAQRGTWMELPEHIASKPEPQDDFYALHGAYPLRGRPFGIAFVWSNVYQDSSGANALQIAEDSALRFAEMLQCMGYEVRPRKNVRRKYIMDDLSDENLAVLRDVYDTVLVYVAGCGDGKSFLSQYNETITIEEVWERFDAAGVVGKPRVLVMDLFQIRSTLMDNFMEDLKATQRSVEDFQREMDALELQGLEHPPSMLQRMKQLRDELEFKRARKKELRHPPAAGLPARMAIMGVPLAAGVVTWKIKIVRLAYQITLGVCNPDPLQKWHGIGVERYTGLHDYCGSDEHGWAFNQCGNPLHNVHGGEEKPMFGRIAHLRAGDEVTMTLDMTQGVLRMEVPEKFRPARTKLVHPLLVNPAEQNLHLVGAITLYDLGDEIEVVSWRSSDVETVESEMSLYTGPIWDPSKSADGLNFEGNVARRVEGDGLPDMADTLVFVHRQPVGLAPRSFTDRGKPVGECWRGIYNCEAEEADGLSLFSHLLARRLQACMRDQGEPPEDANFDKWEQDGVQPSAWENVRQCVTVGMLEKLEEDLHRYALTCWIKSYCGQTGVNLDEVAVAFERHNMGVDDVKVITEKIELEDLGITKRQQLDGVFRGIKLARDEAAGATHKLRIFCLSTLRKKFIVCGPGITWSQRHLGEAFIISREGDLASKCGQSRSSNTIMCSLESSLRGIKKFGAVMAGGGKHAWDFTIQRLRSTQGDDRTNIGSIRLGVVQSEAILYGEYSVATGMCRGGTPTTVVLDHEASEEDGAYEGLQIILYESVAGGQSSRIYGYTGADRTLDVILETAPDAKTKYAITRLTGFEIGDDDFSWALASSTTGRSAAMHGNTAAYSSKAFGFQGVPNPVNRVSGAGFEQENTYPRNLGDALKEGDVVTCWLDLELGVLAFSVNGNKFGDAVTGVTGPVVPAASCPAATECAIVLGNYRRWAAESGWASASSAEDMGLSDDELLELKRAFRQYDREGSGSIKIKQMRGLVSDLGVMINEAELNDFLDQVDADGSGTLDIMEFYKLISDMKEAGAWSMEMYAGKAKKSAGGGAA